MNLKGKNVIITGAAGGIGRNMSLAFASKGANISLVDRAEAQLETVRKEVEAKGVKAVAIAADVTVEADIERIVKDTESGLGQVDVLVNNAGIMPFKLTVDHSAAEVMAALMVNVYGPIRLSQSVLVGMLERGSGRIVNIGSTFGSMGFPYFSVYSATKGAMKIFTESLRRELHDVKGVGVTYVAPRAVKSSQPEIFFEMAKKMKMNLDEPGYVSDIVVSAVEKGESEVYIGGQEKFFMLINKLKPSMIDGGLKKQVSIMKEYCPKMSK